MTASKVSCSEQLLASRLRAKGLEFRQQVRIGGYSVDFLIEPNIVIEAEGVVHAHTQDRDADRTVIIESLGYRVFRVPNYTIFSDATGIAEMIRLQTCVSNSGFEILRSPNQDSVGMSLLGKE